jgi:hypothetical protein
MRNWIPIWLVCKSCTKSQKLFWNHSFGKREETARAAGTSGRVNNESSLQGYFSGSKIPKKMSLHGKSWVFKYQVFRLCANLKPIFSSPLLRILMKEGISAKTSIELSLCRVVRDCWLLKLNEWMDREEEGGATKNRKTRQWRRRMLWLLRQRAGWLHLTKSETRFNTDKTATYSL